MNKFTFDIKIYMRQSVFVDGALRRADGSARNPLSPVQP